MPTKNSPPPFDINRTESSTSKRPSFFDGECNANYTSIFLKYTNEVIAYCTSDVEFDARIQFRLEALKKVYDADFAAVYAISRVDGFVDTIFTTEMPARIALPPRFDLRPLLPLKYLAEAKEDDLVCFAKNDADGVFVPTTRSKLANNHLAITAMPIIIADRRIWVVVCSNPRRFAEYTLSLSLGAGAIKTELSKRIMLEEIGLFGGFCGRDSGIGPAQRAKTTIWN